MATDTLGFYDYFLTRLGDWAMGIPLQSFWVIIIDFPTSIQKVWLERFKTEFEPINWEKLKEEAYGGLITSPYQNEYSTNSLSQDEYLFGCMFARSIAIPGEKTELASPAIQNASGLLFPSISKNRSSLPELDISFIETNSSFVDNVIRPWNIIGSHLGLISRPAGENIKGKIRVIFYAKPKIGENDYLRKTNVVYDNDKIPILSHSKSIAGVKDSKPLIKRKIFVFHDVVPTVVSSQEYTQSGDALLIRPVKFTYSSYSYEAPTTNPL